MGTWSKDLGRNPERREHRLGVRVIWGDDPNPGKERPIDLPCTIAIVFTLLWIWRRRCCHRLFMRVNAGEADPELASGSNLIEIIFQDLHRRNVTVR